MYRAVTVCEVRDGQNTAFWEHRWLSVGRLKECFPILLDVMQKQGACAAATDGRAGG
jgi:hypothetical protein